MEEEKREKQEPGKGLFLKRWKEWKIGKDQFVICILAGILLMLLAVPTSKKSGMESAEYGLLDSNTGIIKKDGGERGAEDNGEETAALGTPGSVEDLGDTEAYEKYMENKLEQAISLMEGAGKVKVMVTVSASRELVVEKDRPTAESHTSEQDAEGGSRGIDELEKEEETIYNRESDGSSSPFVTKTLQPLVEGVVVVAQGGERPEVKKNITEAIMALFDVEPHKIKVVKMKSE